MSETTPRIRSLLRQANKVADSGKRSAATKLYRQILDEAPDSAEAWIGLAGVLREESSKEEALTKALELDPGNAEASRQLAVLRGEILDEVEEIDIEADASKIEEVVEAAAADNLDDSVEIADELDATTEEAAAVNVPVETKAEAAELDHEDEHEVGYVEEVLYCANHPGRQTHLRCNKCGKPICTSCAQRTPVGYRCPQCIREHEDIFYTAKPLDYLITLLIAGPLSIIAGYVAPLIGFFVIFLAAATGTLIGRLVLWAIQRRRGRWLPLMVGVLVVIGAAIPYLLALLNGNLVISFRILWSGVYIVMASGAAYYQMR